MTEFESHPTEDGGHAVGPYEQDPTPEVAVPGLPEVPTQIAFPLRALVRTGVQALVGLVLAWLTRVAGIEVTDGTATALVDLISSAVWVGGTMLAAWVMTRPAVAKVIARTPLAPAPAHAYPTS